VGNLVGVGLNGSEARDGDEGRGARRIWEWVDLG